MWTVFTKSILKPRWNLSCRTKIYSGPMPTSYKSHTEVSYTLGWQGSKSSTDIWRCLTIPSSITCSPTPPARRQSDNYGKHAFKDYSAGGALPSPAHLLSGEIPGLILMFSVKTCWMNSGVCIPVYNGVVGQWRDNIKVPCHPFKAITTPQWSTMDQCWCMGFNLTVNGTIECDASITVWYCWSCARCEGSNPCSRQFATNTITLCERKWSLSRTTPPGTNSCSKPGFQCHMQAASALTFINKQTLDHELKLRM